MYLLTNLFVMEEHLDKNISLLYFSHPNLFWHVLLRTPLPLE